MRAAGYIRVSTEEQARDGISLDAQREQVERYCQRLDLDLVELCEDDGVSASRPLPTRAGGAGLLSLCGRRKDPIHAVVTWRLDRLFRDTQECLAAVEKWEKQGVGLHLIQMGGSALDTSSAMGRFFLTIMASAAELERSTTSERTREGMRHLREQGLRYCGIAPWGWRHDGGRLVVDVDEVAVLARMRSLREAGVSYRAIAEVLDRDGVPARASRWHERSIRRILKRS